MADDEGSPATGSKVVPLSEVEEARKSRSRRPRAADVPIEPRGEPTSAAPIALGYDRGTYYYLSPGGGQIIAVTADQHTKLKLMSLAASETYWECTPFFNPRLGMQWDKAAEWLMRCCEQVGIYDPNRVRGRGAWWDKNRAVLHLGHSLIVDGESVEIGDFETKFVYERALPLNVNIGKPLDTKEARRFIDLCDLVSFETSDMSLLFAGWCVIAAVCGALQWRTHLWMVGAAGTGKSWLVDNILRVMLGGIALSVQSKTTEAGVRRGLWSDARPVIFDEAETETQFDRQRMQQVLDLARQSSQEDGAPILKGNRKGGVDMFNVRSCFFFSSINLGMSAAADESRTVLLTLIGAGEGEDPEARAAKFDHLQRTATTLLTDEYVAGFIARTISLMGVIRINAEHFARAASEVFGSRRQGDTLGALLAGVHSLYSHRPLTLDEARAFVREKVWVKSAVERSETMPEHERAINRLIEQVVRISVDHATVERSIGELIEAEWLSRDDSNIINAQAGDNLLRLGIMRQGPYIYLARNHSKINSIYKETAWSNSWSKTLANIPGAEIVKGAPTRFGSFVKRALKIPLKAVFPDADEYFR